MKKISDKLWCLSNTNYETFVADQIPIEMADQSQLLQDAFQKFDSWLKQEFSRPVRIAIYGGAYTGCMAYHFLKKNNQVQLCYIFNREVPAKNLFELQHINLETLTPESNVNLDIVVIATRPLNNSLFDEFYYSNLLILLKTNFKNCYYSKVLPHHQYIMLMSLKTLMKV